MGGTFRVMSELIDNRARRIDTLKSVIQRLHEGEDPAKVKKDLAELVRECDASEIAEMEQQLIRRTLEHTGGNRTHSADLLGIGVRTLQRKIQTYAISIPPKRRRPRRDRTTDASAPSASSRE